MKERINKRCFGAEHPFLLGVIGIIISGIPLTIAMNFLPLLIFHESPPPTY